MNTGGGKATMSLNFFAKPTAREPVARKGKEEYPLLVTFNL